MNNVIPFSKLKAAGIGWEFEGYSKSGRIYDDGI